MTTQSCCNLQAINNTGLLFGFARPCAWLNVLRSRSIKFRAIPEEQTRSLRYNRSLVGWFSYLNKMHFEKMYSIDVLFLVRVPIFAELFLTRRWLDNQFRFFKCIHECVILSISRPTNLINFVRSPSAVVFLFRYSLDVEFEVCWAQAR